MIIYYKINFIRNREINIFFRGYKTITLVGSEDEPVQTPKFRIVGNTDEKTEEKIEEKKKRIPKSLDIANQENIDESLVWFNYRKTGQYDETLYSENELKIFQRVRDDIKEEARLKEQQEDFPFNVPEGYTLYKQNIRKNVHIIETIPDDRGFSRRVELEIHDLPPEIPPYIHMKEVSESTSYASRKNGDYLVHLRMDLLDGELAKINYIRREGFFIWVPSSICKLALDYLDNKCNKPIIYEYIVKILFQALFRLFKENLVNNVFTKIPTDQNCRLDTIDLFRFSIWIIIIIFKFKLHKLNIKLSSMADIESVLTKYKEYLLFLTKSDSLLLIGIYRFFFLIKKHLENISNINYTFLTSQISDLFLFYNEIDMNNESSIIQYKDLYNKYYSDMPDVKSEFGRIDPRKKLSSVKRFYYRIKWTFIYIMIRGDPYTTRYEAGEYYRVRKIRLNKNDEEIFLPITFKKKQPLNGQGALPKKLKKNLKEGKTISSYKVYPAWHKERSSFYEKLLKNRTKLELKNEIEEDIIRINRLKYDYVNTFLFLSFDQKFEGMPGYTIIIRKQDLDNKTTSDTENYNDIKDAKSD